jgi:CheY-like chemotaxis protein
VTPAGNGAEAVHIAASADFDVIVSDMRMPRMDGLEMARRIRGLAAPRCDTPIVLLTADMRVSDAPGFAEAGITLTMPKPYDRAQLLEAVQSAFAQVGSGREPPLFDPDALARLAATMSGPALAEALATLAGRVEALIALAPGTDAGGEQGLLDLAHDTGSVAGLMGFGALSVALQRYQQVDAGQRAAVVAPGGGLLTLARRSLDVLRARLQAAEPMALPAGD